MFVEIADVTLRMMCFGNVLMTLEMCLLLCEYLLYFPRGSKLLSIIFAEDTKLSVCQRVAQNYCQYGITSHISI